jgi:hypothetical protein
MTTPAVTPPPSTNLSDLVAQLKREVAVPGQFAQTFPNTTDLDLQGSLSDGFGQAQLVGFLQTSVLDLSAGTVSPVLSPAAQALVVLYAADRILTMRLLDMNARVAYSAGPVKYEVQKSSQMLTEALKDIQARRTEILTMAADAGRSRGAFAMTDMYGGRVMGDLIYYQGTELDYFYVHELSYLSGIGPGPYAGVL